MVDLAIAQNSLNSFSIVFLDVYAMWRDTVARASSSRVVVFLEFSAVYINIFITLHTLTDDILHTCEERKRTNVSKC